MFVPCSQLPLVAVVSRDLISAMFQQVIFASFSTTVPFPIRQLSCPTSYSYRKLKNAGRCGAMGQFDIDFKQHSPK